MDEVDSLLSQRSDNEHECSRRIKNEFFIQLDGAATNEDDHVVVIGATNRPQELDEAVRRRFVRRIYVSLPVAKARKLIIQKLIQQIHHNLTEAQIEELAQLTEGYSGADMDSLCRYAAMEPLRALTTAQIDVIDAKEVSKFPHRIIISLKYVRCRFFSVRCYGSPSLEFIHVNQVCGYCTYTPQDL